jgi:hypothetical protein
MYIQEGVRGNMAGEGVVFIFTSRLVREILSVVRVERPYLQASIVRAPCVR